MALLSFPSNFLWGSTTSAYQVEGHNFNNDWWDWEQVPGHIKGNDSSREASDWWNGRYREDFERAQGLGHNTHRLSIEWSRVEPSEGEWDANALQFYREVLSELHQRGMTPLVDLHHFTNPRWLAAKDAWENPAVVQYFERYATTVAQELGISAPRGSQSTSRTLTPINVIRPALGPLRKKGCGRGWTH